jgi:ketosteroid isomerase-like protein
MTESASGIVRSLLERYERGGVEDVLELLAPDAVFVVPPETSAEPDVYEGHEGARRYFAGFGGALDDVRFDLIDVQDESPDTALAVIRLSGLGSATRIPVELTAAVTFVVKGGAVARAVAHPDVDSARRGIARGL